MAAGWFATGSILCGLGVILGAFGAHGLRERLTPEMLVVFETGVRYHLTHGLGLLAIAWAVSRWPDTYVNIAGYLFVAGILIFSGSLYVLSMTGIRWLGAITPLGGVCLIIGWGLLAVGVLRAS